MRQLKAFAVSLLLAVVSMTAYAQKRTVSGTVLDEQSFPIIGAAVMLEGPSIGAVTEWRTRSSSFPDSTWCSVV